MMFNLRRAASLLALVFFVAGVGGVTGCGAPPESSVPPGAVRISFGPFNVAAAGTVGYDGSASTGEVQLCRTLKLDNEEQIAVNRIDVKMNLGSHHFILFRSKGDFADDVFPCWGTVNFDDWDFMMDVNRAGGEDWQIDPGLGFVLEPHQQLMVQVHYVNAKTVQAPLGGMVTADLYTTPRSNIVHPIHGLFTVNTAVSIPPYTPYMGYSSSRNCTFTRDASIVAMTGHFHARGDQFTVDWMGNNGQFDYGQIYLSQNWDAPPFTTYTPPKLIGAVFEGLHFTCSYHNDTANTIGWGGHADVQEHCNLFFQYYTADDQPTACAEGSGGW